MPVNKMQVSRILRNVAKTERAILKANTGKFPLSSDAIARFATHTLEDLRRFGEHEGLKQLDGYQAVVMSLQAGRHFRPDTPTGVYVRWIAGIRERLRNMIAQGISVGVVKAKGSKMASAKFSKPAGLDPTDSAHWDSIVRDYPKLNQLYKTLQRIHHLLGKSSPHRPDGAVRNLQVALSLMEKVHTETDDLFDSRTYGRFEGEIKIVKEVVASLNTGVDLDVVWDKLRSVIGRMPMYRDNVAAQIQGGKQDLQLMARGWTNRKRGQERPPRITRRSVVLKAAKERNLL